MGQEGERLARAVCALPRGAVLFARLVLAPAEHGGCRERPLERGVAKAKQVITDHMNSFRRAVAAGVRVAMGTDSGVGEHGQNARELSLMVEGGMTPRQALVAATGDAARLLYPSDPPVGTLHAGKIADLLLVTRDPLRDLHVLENQSEIKLIVRNGTIYKSTL